MDYEGDSYGAYTPTLAGDGVEGAVDDSFDEVGGEEEEGEDWIDEDEEVEAEEGGEDVMQGSGMQAQARERVLEEQEGEAPGSETEEELTSGDDEAATKEDDLGEFLLKPWRHSKIAWKLMTIPCRRESNLPSLAPTCAR
jgi:hypothetical protein